MESFGEIKDVTTNFGSTSGMIASSTSSMQAANAIIKKIIPKALLAKVLCDMLIFITIIFLKIY
jgi:hypothetical protein